MALHANYPHEPGYLIGCPVCDFNCHCGPGVKAGTETQCVFIGHDEEDQGWRAATDDEAADYHAGYITASENVRETVNGLEIRD